VVDLIHGGNDLLAVELAPAASPPAGGQPAPGRRVLIPFVEAIVPIVNLQEGWIGLTPPPGLLEL
jgi:16S rRNA processing protein RimM